MSARFRVAFAAWWLRNISAPDPYPPEFSFGFLDLKDRGLTAVDWIGIEVQRAIRDAEVTK